MALAGHCSSVVCLPAPPQWADPSSCGIGQRATAEATEVALELDAIVWGLIAESYADD